MNTLRRRAPAALGRLPDSEKEAIANRFLEDAAAERGWDGRFPHSRYRLAQIARHAREHDFRGSVLRGDPSERRFQSGQRLG